MYVRHPKQPVSKQLLWNIQLSSKDGYKKKRKNKQVLSFVLFMLA